MNDSADQKPSRWRYLSVIPAILVVWLIYDVLIHFQFKGIMDAITMGIVGMIAIWLIMVAWLLWAQRFRQCIPLFIGILAVALFMLLTSGTEYLRELLMDYHGFGKLIVLCLLFVSPYIIPLFFYRWSINKYKEAEQVMHVNRS